jgi:D-alanyl-D-alanine carboxypeptidase
MKYLLAFLFFICSNVYAQTGSYLLYDFELGTSQVAHNINEVRPIASITKLFTAIIILRSGEDLNEKVKVQGKSSGRFPRGTKIARIDLMRAMLISSDNLAAETLANTYPGGFKKYIQDVNQYARGMGLINTKLVDSTGLLSGNISTAKELIVFLSKIEANEVIRNIANERHDSISVPKGKKKLIIKLRNTNPSLFVFDNILISKTGFTNAAGRCVVMLVEKNNKLYGIAILGQKNVRDRSEIAKELIQLEALESPKDEPIEFVFPI